jgi:hypothetical protein
MDYAQLVYKSMRLAGPLVPAVIRRVVLGAHSASTGAPASSANDDYPCEVNLSVATEKLNGNLVQTGDLSALLASKDCTTRPRPDDRLILVIDGVDVSHEIVNINPIYTEGIEPIAYTLLVRK